MNSFYQCSRFFWIFGVVWNASGALIMGLEHDCMGSLREWLCERLCSNDRFSSFLRIVLDSVLTALVCGQFRFWGKSLVKVRKRKRKFQRWIGILTKTVPIQYQYTYIYIYLPVLIGRSYELLPVSRVLDRYNGNILVRLHGVSDRIWKSECVEYKVLSAVGKRNSRGTTAFSQNETDAKTRKTQLKMVVRRTYAVLRGLQI